MNVRAASGNQGDERELLDGSRPRTSAYVAPLRLRVASHQFASGTLEASRIPRRSGCIGRPLL